MMYHQITFEERYTLGVLRQRGLLGGGDRPGVGAAPEYHQPRGAAQSCAQRRDLSRAARRLVRPRAPLPLPAQSPVLGGRLGPDPRVAPAGLESRANRGVAASPSAVGHQPRNDLSLRVGGQTGRWGTVGASAGSPEAAAQTVRPLRQPRPIGGEAPDYEPAGRGRGADPSSGHWEVDTLLGAGQAGPCALEPGRAEDRLPGARQAAAASGRRSQSRGPGD